MRVSIIIPVYNVKSFLHICLDSIINQTHKDLDIVCVDDGSTDGSSDILRMYAERDLRIQYISQANSGAVIARQVAVNAAKGDYILFCDPDDWLDPNTCEIVLDFALKTQADVVQYGVVAENCNTDEDKRDVEKWFKGTINVIDSGVEMLSECFEKRSFAWNIIGKCVRATIAKQAFKAQERIDFSNSTDIYSSYYLYCYAKSWQRIESPQLYHYRWGNGVSTKKNIPLDTFLYSLQQFDGLNAMKRFAEGHFSPTDYRYIVVQQYIPYIMIEASLDVGLNRLEKDVDVTMWINKLCDKAGIQDVLYVLTKKAIAINHQNRLLTQHTSYQEQMLITLNEQIKLKENEICAQRETIVNLQKELPKNKVQKFLRKLLHL